MSLDLIKPLLGFVSTVRSQTCTLGPGGAETAGASLRVGGSTSGALPSLQQSILTTLSSLPPGNLLSTLRGLIDATVTYALKFVGTLLQVPVDYVKLALQFGIRTPSLDDRETCEQGDLKQLLMWGMSHNVSWSLGSSLVNILLAVFLVPEQSVCTYPGTECRSTPRVTFQRTFPNEADDYRNVLLKCDHPNLAELNDTLCANVLASSGAGSSPSLLTLCQALSSLDTNQMEQVWSNMCSAVQALVSPFVDKAANCPTEHVPPSQETVPHRVAREASNLQQLACDYNSWLENGVEAVLVSLCSDNEREEFVARVCANALLMRKLLADRATSWLYGYCANSSADPSYLVDHFCEYDHWVVQPTDPVAPALLEFCLNLDGPRLSRLVCQNTGLFMILFSNPENGRLMPNCSALTLPPPAPDKGSLTLDSCRYSEWRDVSKISFDLLSQCIRFDHSGFAREVCTNATFLNKLLVDQGNAWLGDHCSTSLSMLTPEPTRPFDIADWCDYSTWGERQVDDSVVALCWQNDRAAFEKNVCCQVDVFEKLSRDPQNTWLKSVCSNIDEAVLLAQLCRYSEWTHPIIVDMTDLALCAEKDSQNFSSKVCANTTVLQNLLANQDNGWLIQHCANQSEPGGDGGKGGVGGFNPSEQCQYSSWTITLPDVSLLTLCWEHDQTSNGNATCLVWNLARQFNWTCSTDLASACEPGAGQGAALQMMAHCWVESLGSNMEYLLSPPVAAVLEQAVSSTVVVLLALEEVRNVSLHVTENIRRKVLETVIEYLKNEDNFAKKRVLLQCFGRVLTNLMKTTRDATSEQSFIIKEYFSIPLSSLESVLGSAHVATVRLILQYYDRNRDALQLSDAYLSIMASVLFQKHLMADDSLFPDVAPLLVTATPADIQALPALQNSTTVRETINRNMWRMNQNQRLAFGVWYGKALSPSNITLGPPSIIRDTGNLIAYLPFHDFQHLSPAQLLEGLEVLRRNTLTPLKQEFIAQRITGTFRNLTAQEFTRLGNLSCLADPEDLLVYKDSGTFGVIQNIILNCTRAKRSLPSRLVSSLLLDNADLKSPSSLGPARLAELSPFLPFLGAPFLQALTLPQLLATLPALSSTEFSPAQAAIIVDKVSPSSTLTAPGQLEELGSLVVGMKAETFLSLTSDRLLSSLPAMAQQTPGLSPTQANAVATKLWGFPEVTRWLDDVEPLLASTPLLSVQARTHQLVNNVTAVSMKPWNTQQAKAIFKELKDTKPDSIKQDFLSLGTLGQGVSCEVLQERFRADPSRPAVRNILTLLRQQPGPLHTSLKTCVIDELYQFEFFSELLQDLGAEIALSMPVSTIKKFPAGMMDTLRIMINKEYVYFLMLSRTEQELVVDKMLQRMEMYTGLFTEEEFRLLGIMAPFVVDEVFVQLDRSFFTQNLDYLSGLCYRRTKMDIVARILQEPATFGAVENWNQTTLSQVDRFLFFLPEDKLQDIPPALMTVGRIERLFMSQRRWERGDVGLRCLDDGDRKWIFEKQQFVLQFFLGFLKINPASPAPTVPTCEVLHTTAPSAWTSSSLTAMSVPAFSSCLELMGQDPFLASYQRSEVFKRVKEIHGPVSSFSQSLIAQLGGVAVEMSMEELGSLRLMERRSIAAVGAISSWSQRQLAVLFAVVLNSTKQSPSQLDSSTLVAMGHLVCGAKTTEMNLFNAVEFSKAALWLGQLRLSCSEEQLLVLVGLLSHSLAFGPISSWGADVFIEIGVLAAGVPDMAMSALVKEQIEGVTPVAIAMIPPDKFAVVFDQRQIGMFSYAQAAAVTDDQLAALSDVQRTALAMVLTPREDRLVDFRGRSLGFRLSHGPVCVTLGLLVQLMVAAWLDT
ncbi:stereocilin [Takifugu rubripes]|uniref:stereocilin n=1 Tax=Takifugu rubripes TaxID=31033 RepID=UPI0011451BD3|nr:stereocilin-like [Takifugu rubripes]